MIAPNCALSATSQCSTGKQLHKSKLALPKSRCRGLLHGRPFLWALRSVEGRSPRLRARRSLKTQQRVRPRSFGSFWSRPGSTRRSFKVPSGAGGTAAEQNHSVKSGRIHGVLGSAEQYGVDSFPIDSGMPGLSSRAGAMTRKFFTESLILAQDERWRRA